MSIFVDEIGGVVKEAYLIDPKQNLGFLGPVGVGKTDVVYQITDELRQGLNCPDFFIKPLILSQMSASCV